MTQGQGHCGFQESRGNPAGELDLHHDLGSARHIGIRMRSGAFDVHLTGVWSWFRPFLRRLEGCRRLNRRSIAFRGRYAIKPLLHSDSLRPPPPIGSEPLSNFPFNSKERGAGGLETLDMAGTVSMKSNGLIACASFAVLTALPCALGAEQGAISTPGSSTSLIAPPSSALVGPLRDRLIAGDPSGSPVWSDDAPESSLLGESPDAWSADPTPVPEARDDASAPPLETLPSSWEPRRDGDTPPAASEVLSPVGIVPVKDGDFEDRSYWKQGLLKRVWRDQKFLVTRWAPSEARNARFFTPLLIGLAAAVSGHETGGIDRSVELNTNSNGSGKGRGAARALTSLGNGSTAAVIVGSAYFLGRWMHHDRITETASLSAETLLDVGIWVTLLKTAAARTRPAGGGRGDFFEYKTPSGQSNGSFPSGHAMGAFAFATVIAREYGDKKWVPWVAYGTAGLISYSRLVLHRHFASDVIVGAVLGNSIGRMVWTRAHGEKGSLPGQIGPILDPSHKSYGVSWTYTW